VKSILPCLSELIFVCLITFAGICGAESLCAQAVPAATYGTSLASRINFSIINTAQHSSVTGWSDNLTPDLSYRFNHHLSIDAKFPWYLTIQNFVKTNIKNAVTSPLEQAQYVIGDTSIAGQYVITHHKFGYTASVNCGFATGDSNFGLSANTTTYNVNNHLEHSMGPFTPDIEIGEGNSSNLIHYASTKPYTAVGQIANFQAGSGIDLPWNLSLELEAYENLPLGNQNIYGTITKTGKNGKIKTKQVLEGKGVAEDNGFTAELGLSLNKHTTLTGNYERSLIQGIDTAEISITWMLRASKKHISFGH